jgi:hypothetical protein
VIKFSAGVPQRHKKKVNMHDGNSFDNRQLSSITAAHFYMSELMSKLSSSGAIMARNLLQMY